MFNKFRISESSFERYATIRLVAIAVILWMVAIIYSPSEDIPSLELGSFPIEVEETTTIKHSDGRVDVKKASIAAASVAPVNAKAGMTVPTKLANADKHVRAFIKRWLPTAADMANRYDIPISSQLAQSAKETGWGLQGTLVNKANNFFGIKCKGKTHNHSKCVYHAGNYWVKYGTPWESWKHHAQFLTGDRYKKCLEKQSTASYNICIAQAGYCDPPYGYGESINTIIAQYDLDTFDGLTPAEAKAVAAKIK